MHYGYQAVQQKRRTTTIDFHEDFDEGTEELEVGMIISGRPKGRDINNISHLFFFLELCRENTINNIDHFLADRVASLIGPGKAVRPRLNNLATLATSRWKEERRTESL